MARRDGDLVAGITAYADGPDEMREVIRHHVNLGVDNIKLSMSGEEVSKLKNKIRSFKLSERLNITVEQPQRHQMHVIFYSII